MKGGTGSRSRSSLQGSGGHLGGPNKRPEDENQGKKDASLVRPGPTGQRSHDTGVQTPCVRRRSEHPEGDRDRVLATGSVQGRAPAAKLSGSKGDKQKRDRYILLQESRIERASRQAGVGGSE